MAGVKNQKDEIFGKYLKLTNSKIMVKSGSDTYTIWSMYDNKKLIINDDDIEEIERQIVIGNNEYIYADRMADAVLTRYLVKFCADKNYYALADRNNFFFIMGLKKETFCKIIDHYRQLS
jgi:hypothetical protein